MRLPKIQSKEKCLHKMFEPVGSHTRMYFTLFNQAIVADYYYIIIIAYTTSYSTLTVDTQLCYIHRLMSSCQFNQI